jgi:SET domain
VLFESEPLVDLSSLTPQQETELQSNLVPTALCGGGDAAPFRDAVVVPGDVDAQDVGKFRSLVHAGAWFVVFRPSEESVVELSELYSPSTTDPHVDERRIVQLAQRALAFLKKSSEKGSTMHKRLVDGSEELLDQQVLRVMLVWACNAFDGGRVYKLQSRVNHSCRPNAVVYAEDASSSSQTIRAASEIAAGEEVRISYLGTLLYGDTLLRRDELRRSKHFTCKCERCEAPNSTDGTPDAAGSVPCVVCHPRAQRKRQLDEDTQYDDDQTVNYMIPTLMHDASWVWKCEACQSSVPEHGNKEYAPAFEACRSVSRTVASYLREHSSRGMNDSHPPPSAAGTDDNGFGADKQDDSAVLEEHLTLASSIAGARHWTTNLLLLLQLDQMLQDFHGRLLRSDVDDAPSSGAEGDDLEALASGIDMLERVCRFVDGLHLPLHRGHVLSHVIIGVARALVSLGDAKSCTYARDWLRKLDGYTEIFESEGIQKVVATLKERAPQERNDADDDRKAKKMKAR